MSSGLALHALRVAVVVVPATLIVLCAGPVAALAFTMDRDRRQLRTLVGHWRPSGLSDDFGMAVTFLAGDMR